MNANQRRKAVRKFRKEVAPKLVHARLLGMTQRDVLYVMTANTLRGKQMLDDFIEVKIWFQTHRAS